MRTGLDLAPLTHELLCALPVRKTSADPEYGFVLMGSTVLMLHGALAPARVNDVDLIMRPGLYERLAARPGWEELRPEWRGELDPPFLEWHPRRSGMEVPVHAAALMPERDSAWRDADKALRTSQTVCGWPCARLPLMREWYVRAGRPKDTVRIEAIDAHECPCRAVLR